MFFIPGIVISILTFPGVIVHELAHQIFCYIMKIPVYEVKYFQFKNPSGYVIHERTDDPLKSFFISVGPFLINTILGIIIMAPVSIELIGFEDLNNILSLFLAWIGISILMHAFPSVVDGKGLVDSILKNKDVNIFVKIITAPVIGLIYLGAIGSAIWLDLIYAIWISLALPRILVNII
ncbi:DUF3267 domain-containing protein [Clostridium bornimense]|uniref:metalloprotease family protein n=1 Tax=Clostridium bornimense TaxID=1216932 RepID=UPI001C113756|nr:metalloprotease family protein [Clostridium bornimense]MBU5316854.1 DUF3267 domain-containing protein [Clostridium bornimense]